MFDAILKKVLGTKHQRELKRLRPQIDKINALEPQFQKLDDAQLVAKTAEFKQRIANGASVNDVKFEAFAAAREAGKRALGMRHYDVQMFGGLILHEGKIAEMKTGEGKTLVATLPCYLNALEGKGVHVVTVNDYLAKRDAEWMGKLHRFMGLECGVIHSGIPAAAKKRAYAADITYGQNNEFGFDYMRDNMKFSIYDYVQRDLHYAIVDEVDSILIDEARTPLIISGPGETASEKYRQINEIIPKLRNEEHYELDEKGRQVTLTEEGMETSQRLLFQKGLIETNNLYDPLNLESLHILNQCLRAHTLYKRDVNYMVSGDGKVMIIDDFTGRTLPGRRWSDGLHQAVEAKEHVAIQDENVTLATISFQNLFRLYRKLSGMTGTADTEAAEFHKTYELDVVVVPTNRPIQRQDHEDLVYKSEAEKFKAISLEIIAAHERGQPVLVGTTSVEKSEAIARVLERRNIKSFVLNAKHHESEAYVVAQAGRKGAITVATNMAGRGTDIVLGGNPEMLARMDVIREMAEAGVAVLRPGQQAPEGVEAITEAELEARIAETTEVYRERCAAEKKEVLDAGGLAIIGTERHESRRIDNQLRGRSGRQGDPGLSRFYLSLEDDLMRIFAGDRVRNMMDRLGMEEDVPIEHSWVTKAVENAQKKVEERNFDIRKNLLEYDDVMNQQRTSIYTLRKQVLMGQYRTVPTQDERKKGKEPQPMVKTVDEALAERAKGLIEQMVKFHGAELPGAQPTEEEVQAFRERAAKATIADLTKLRVESLERDLYTWFGCQLELRRFENDPQGAFDFIVKEVGMTLSEQFERLLDLVDEIIGVMVNHACPEGRSHDDWDLPGLEKAFKEQFNLDASGFETASSRVDIARKLYGDVEAVIRKKAEDFGPESYLRLFRDIYMQEIDKQWMDHLQAMDHLRDGIGLRGYGQRDPKREYKREGFNLFMQMMQSIQSSVAKFMLYAQRVSEEDLQRQEEERQRRAEARAKAMQTRHTGAATAGGDNQSQPPQGGQGAKLSPQALPPGMAARQQAQGAAPTNRHARRRAAAQGKAVGDDAQVQTVKRDKPKVGRNDPCWCGSGKKYKSCHYREDQADANA